MRIEEHIGALRAQGESLAGAVERAGPASGILDAMVPGCPEWTVRELVRHTGRVHRWATAYVLSLIHI